MGKKTVIYIGEEELQAVVYNTGRKKPEILFHHFAALPAGCVINGIIVNEEAFLDAIMKFRAGCRFRLEKADLIVDSSHIMVKAMAVPDRMKHKQFLYTARAELQAIDKKKESVYDYSEICPKNPEAKRDILCGGIRRDMVEQYMAIFRDAGIQIVGMDALLDCVVHMVEYIPFLCRRTIILCVLNGQNAISFLFSNGSYIMHSRNRLLAERKEGKAIRELIGRITTMCQFSQNQKEFDGVRAVYFFGLLKEEEPELAMLAEAVHLKTEIFSLKDYVEIKAPESIPFDRMAGILSVVLPARRKKFNFAEAMKRKAVVSVEKTGTAGLVISSILAVFVVLLLASASVMLGNRGMEKEISRLHFYTEKEENLEEYERLLRLKKKIGQYETEISQMEKIREELLGNPQPDLEIFNAVREQAGTISCINFRYSSETGILSFSCYAGNYHGIAGFVKDLREAGIFSDVEYSGYTFDKSVGMYSFGISGSLKGRKGGMP